MNTKNVAAVMVTATLPAFARQGSRIDVAVSALGDSKSLLGGTLLVTPLLGADGEAYAVAQGALSVGGFQAQGDAETVTRGVPTAARIPAGAIIEREVQFELDELTAGPAGPAQPRLHHRRADRRRDQRPAGCSDGAGVGSDDRRLPVPAAYGGRVAQLLSEIEQLPVEPDTAARIMIDERSGIIVMGDNVRISRVAVAQGNLTVRVTETPQVSQPNPLANGRTAEVPRTNIQVDTQSGHRMVALEPGVTLRDLVDGLNALGVGPRDLIGILQAIKAAGALQAEIEVM